jgi:hypothetical protein
LFEGSPEGGPDRGGIFQLRSLGHLYSEFVDRSRALLQNPTVFEPGGKCRRLHRATTLLLLAHTACPQQDCPLFVRHSKIVHATCDVVRGLWSLSEGSVRRDRRLNANGGSVGQFLSKRDRWVERKRRSSAKSSIMIIIWKSSLLFF